MKITRFQNILISASLALVLLGDVQAYDSNRTVFVNGQQLTQAEIAQLELLHGDHIPSGNYWLDQSSGYWGYVGGPAPGILGRPDIEFNAGVSEGRSDKRWFEDDVADFCARHGGC